MVAVESKGTKPIDVSTGDLSIRLAETLEEIEAAQALRYRVFCDEMQAKPTDEMRKTGREFDRFDPFCDHVLVMDAGLGKGAQAVVGTYRLMRRAGAAQAGSFYTSGEYDISPLLKYAGEVLELGRSCVAKEYRTGPIMQMLWRGIAEYVHHYDIEIMFGCASLHGTNLDQMTQQLSYLYHHHLAPPALRTRAVKGRFVDMNRLAVGDLDRRRALGALPPLIKGYLRLGAFVGDGAVVDHEFNTTDVCIIVKTDLVTERYLKHYSPREEVRKA